MKSGFNGTHFRLFAFAKNSGENLLVFFAAFVWLEYCSCINSGALAIHSFLFK